MCRSNQAEGSISIRSLISLVILVAVLHGSIKVAPLYVKNYFLGAAIQEYASQAETRSSYEVLKDVLAKAKELDLPVTQENVVIQRVRGESIDIRVSYTVEIEFLGGFYRQFAFHCQSKASFD